MKAVVIITVQVEVKTWTLFLSVFQSSEKNHLPNIQPPFIQSLSSHHSSTYLTSSTTLFILLPFIVILQLVPPSSSSSASLSVFISVLTSLGASQSEEQEALTEEDGWGVGGSEFTSQLHPFHHHRQQLLMLMRVKDEKMVKPFVCCALSQRVTWGGSERDGLVGGWGWREGVCVMLAV